MTEKEQRLLKLQELALSCRQCSLYSTRTKLVFGEGSPNAIVMFLGEAPGRTEDQTGRPFCGSSGQLLRKMIEAIEIPSEDHYIANIVKDRPPNNRAPEREEIDACVKFLKKQIEIISPKLLVLLGKTAVKGLCPNVAHLSVETLRAQSKGLGMINFQDIPAMVTYHPSALLRTSWRKVGAAEDFRFLQSTYREIKGGSR